LGSIQEKDVSKYPLKELKIQLGESGKSEMLLQKFSENLKQHSNYSAL